MNVNAQICIWEPSCKKPSEHKEVETDRTSQSYQHWWLFTHAAHLQLRGKSESHLDDALCLGQCGTAALKKAKASGSSCCSAACSIWKNELLSSQTLWGWRSHRGKRFLRCSSRIANIIWWYKSNAIKQVNEKVMLCVGQKWKLAKIWGFSFIFVLLLKLLLIATSNVSTQCPFNKCRCNIKN